MFRWIGQTIAVTLLGVKTIPQRLGPSIVSVIGIAGVVVVFVSVLSIAEGFRAALVGAGSPTRAIVLRGGSQQEMTSGLTGAEADIIKQAPGIVHAGPRPVAAAEMSVVVDLNKRSTGTPANVPVRGIEPESLQIRDQVKILDGRLPRFGTNEAMVSRAALKQFAGDRQHVQVRGARLTVVGVFSSNGSVNESEVWCDSKSSRRRTGGATVTSRSSPGWIRPRHLKPSRTG
jgi:putative ABC transport system permease protein